uniref:Fluoride ion transporter CrcB n=1 Tax=Pseudo-nitzschia australis TaxID=44445 RepID=A0A7S4AXQ2_9STRA
MEGCTGRTEGMDEIIPSIINALSFIDAPDDIKSSGSTAASRSHRQLQRQRQPGSIDSRTISTTRTSGDISRRRRRQQQNQLHTVETSSTTGTGEENSYLNVFPSIINVFSANDDTDSKNSFSSRIQKANCDDASNSKNTYNGLPKIDHIPRSRSSQNPSLHETCTAQVFPAIRDALSMNDVNSTGEVASGMSGAYPFMRNALLMHDVTDTNQNSVEETSNDGKKESSLNLPSMIDEGNENSSQRGRKPAQKIFVTRAYEVKEHYLESVFYVSISAILGSVFRVYMARIFGFDCEYGDLNDFLLPLASNICVTSGGRTEQTGGALFTDFPSNVFGSFLMGIITPHIDDQRARLPWLHKDHPLQRDEVFHASLGTGFCGCLTTFASWNTQMVVMLDGSYCELGSQAITVLFGYAIGVMGAIYGFSFGRQCGMWMYNFRHRNDDNEANSSRAEIIEVDGLSTSEYQASMHEEVELVDDDNVKLKPVPSHLHKIPLFMTAVALIISFVVGDVISDIEFYKGMILLWFLSPVGSLLRWRLSNLNVQNKEGKSLVYPHWIPWGTFIANMFATVLSACMEGLDDRYFSGSNPTSIRSKWVDATIFALKTGVAGSLSTVSTLVKESVLLSETYAGTAKGHYYPVLTCLSGCLLGIMVYATTIRINK